MGTKVPRPPIEHGDDCNTCTPNPWPAGETPETIYSMFWNVVGCGICPLAPPNGVVFDMHQEPLSPCSWLHDGDVWMPDLLTFTGWPPKSILRLLCHHGHSFFYDKTFPCRPEMFKYVNDQAACILLYAGSEGFGTIFWNEQVLELINSFGLDDLGQLMYEIFRGPATNYVHKFCNLHYRTNVKFLVNY